MAHISQTIKQNQKLIINFAMQRAFAVLQMPLVELSEWLQNELEQNPIFDVIFPATSSDLSWIPQKDTLYEYLKKEIYLHFDNSKEYEVAFFIAGSLNSKGFLTLSEEEICEILKIDLVYLHSIMKRFYQIEPIGLGARNVRETLLLQLSSQKKEKSRLYQLVNKYFDDLLHNRLHLIAKSMHLSTKAIKYLIQKDLKYLNPFPGHQFSKEITQYIIPDLIIDKEDEYWKVEVYENGLPQFHIHPHYMDCLKQESVSKQERNFIRRHLASGKWLLRTLDRRKKILLSIGTYILKKQQDFLEGIEAAPLPLTRKEIAISLHISESTVTRAINQKYVSTPRGTLAISDFFSYTIQTESGAVSNQKAKTLLIKLIESEDKQDPLSDQALTEQLYVQGIHCARRTVTKYRQALKINSRYKRREWG